MSRARILSVGVVTIVCLWAHVRAQVATQQAANPSQPVKSAPVDALAQSSVAGPRFSVVEAKQGEIRGDLAVADALGIRGFRIESTASIEAHVPEGQAFKWVLTLEGELWGIPMLDRHLVFTEKDRDIIKHDIVTRGGPVRSAGKAIRRKDSLLLDPRSGHYHPTKESVEGFAAPKFRAYGFANVEVHDNLLQD